MSSTTWMLPSHNVRLSSEIAMLTLTDCDFTSWLSRTISIVPNSTPSPKSSSPAPQFWGTWKWNQNYNSTLQKTCKIFLHAKRLWKNFYATVTHFQKALKMVKNFCPRKNEIGHYREFFSKKALHLKYFDSFYFIV